MIKFLLLIIASYAFGGNDNLYSIISNPRNISIGGIHASTNSINSMFDSPLKLDGKNNDTFLSVNKFNDAYNIYHISYCVYANNKSNLLLGLVRREIKNNFNTESAWTDDGYPDLGEIDYSQIYKFSDKETGLLIAYNKIVKSNFIMGINFKPIFHRIDNMAGIGFSIDVRYLLLMENLKISFGVDDLLAFKKWDTDLLEKYDLNGYVGFSFDVFDRDELFYEYSLGYGSSIGYEANINKILYLRLGYNKNNSLACGFGLKLKNISLDYGYVNNNSTVSFGNQYSIGFNINFND